MFSVLKRLEGQLLISRSGIGMVLLKLLVINLDKYNCFRFVGFENRIMLNLLLSLTKAF